MGRSRRKYKRSRAKVPVALPKKNPNVFKLAFNVPPKLRALLGATGDEPESAQRRILAQWDDNGSVISNYKSFGFLANPNLLGVRARTNHAVLTPDLQVPPPPSDEPFDDFQPLDSGSDPEDEDLKPVLGKKRKDGQKTEKPLTTMQRAHVRPLIEKYGDDYQEEHGIQLLTRHIEQVNSISSLNESNSSQLIDGLSSLNVREKPSNNAGGALELTSD